LLVHCFPWAEFVLWLRWRHVGDGLPCDASMCRKMLPEPSEV